MISRDKNMIKWFLLNLLKNLSKYLPDRMYLYIKYYIRTGKFLDLKNPVTFNEKIQWLKINDRCPNYVKMVDKYEAKTFVEKQIGSEVIIPTIGVWDKFKDINFNDLPEQFVLKTTHDSGGVVVCKGKSSLNLRLCENILNKSLSRNYYYHGREWPYKSIRPRIIAEEYLVDETNEQLKDYKIFTFNGVPKIIQVDYDRHITHKRNLYNLEWTYIEGSIGYPTDPSYFIHKPEMLDLMLEYSMKLSKNIPHLRVDFYSVGTKIYFGELSFYHGSGFEKFFPESLGEQFGEWLELETL
jgi:hypothetical protein